MTDKFYGNGYVDRDVGPDFGDGCSKEGFVGGCERMGCCEFKKKEFYLKHDTLIYNLYRQLYRVSDTGDGVEPLLRQARKYLEERNLLDQNEED